MELTQEDIQEILRLLEQSSFDELYLETPHLKLIVRRGTGSPQRAGEPSTRIPGSAEQSGESAPPSPPAEMYSGGGGEAVQPAEVDRAARVEPFEKQVAGSTPEIVPDGRVPIAAPLRGIFYRAPRPGAEPFVDAGSPVEPETVVGIIEVMKLMHSITAGVRGTIVDRCVEDGEAVEEGQPLFWVRPAQLGDSE